MPIFIVLIVLENDTESGLLENTSSMDVGFLTTCGRDIVLHPPAPPEEFHSIQCNPILDISPPLIAS